MLFFCKVIWGSVFLHESIKLIYNIRKISAPRFSLDIASVLEISTNIGLSIVLLGSKYTSDSFIFISILLLILSITTFYEFRRIIIMGSEELIVRNKCLKKNEIEGYEVVYTMFYLRTTTNVVRVLTPLSSRSAMKELVKNIKK